MNLLSANGMSGGSGIWPADFLKSPVQFLAEAGPGDIKLMVLKLRLMGCCYMGGFPKIGGKPPKWMVKRMENPY